jgi:diguanylate cyclase
MHSFRNRILFLLVGLVVLTQSVTLFAVLARTSSAVEARAHERLAAGGASVRQQIRFRDGQLANAVSVLGADFGFREAIASGDRLTILSAIENQGQRIDAAFVAVFDADLRPLATTTREVGGLAGMLPAMLAEREAAPAAPHAVMIGRRAYQLFLAPVRAPDTIAWVTMGFALDANFAAQIRNLSGVEVSLLHPQRTGALVVASTLPPGARAAIEAGALQVAAPDYLNFVQPLEFSSGQLQVALHEPLAAAMQPYHELRNEIVAISLTALLVAALVAVRLGRRATRPVAQLAAAAKRIEAGSYDAHLELRGDREFVQLAGTFNAMQQGIAEREARLGHAVFHDALTGLPNLAGAVRRIDAAPDAHAVATLVVLEISGLRDVSATFGHAVADRTLVAIAQRLQLQVRSDDFIARIDSDRFLVIANDGQVKPALALATQLCALLRSGLRIDALNLVFDAIAGVAIAPEHGRTAAELLPHAEIALHDCREFGQSVTLFAPGRDAGVRRRVELGAQLLAAIEGQGLHLAYQPKVSVADGEMTGVEALVRWNHPVHGSISPAEFVPLAERIGVVRSLTRWVMRAAIRQLAQWRLEGLSFDVAINVSAADILDAELGDELVALLRRYQVPPGAVLLEITESALVRDEAAASRHMELLQVMGVRFAMDDFGTGYSSLSLLQKLPVDELKIDRSFLASAHESADDATIVASTIELAHSIGLRVVAEGVEHEASMDLLRRLGCDTAQGFLISRPLAPEAIPAFHASTLRAPPVATEPFAPGRESRYRPARSTTE